jgi:hypothetical protein
MSLGRFEEENLLLFREQALAKYGSGDSEEYVLGTIGRAARRAAEAVGNTINRITGNQPAPVPVQPIGPRISAGASAAPAALQQPAVQAVSSGGGGRSSTPSGGGGGRSSTPSGGGGGRSSTPSGGGGNQPRQQQQQPTETAAQREARIQREREEAERRERERREAEERLRQQREATEAARRERLRSITRDVAQRIIENALVNANKGQSDADSQLCQRPDGSVYGIAKGQSCVSGEPISQRPENDRTQEINEAAKNDPNQQNLPVGWRTTRPDTPSSSSSSSGSTTPPPAPAPVPAESRPASADRRISGNTNEASA